LSYITGKKKKISQLTSLCKIFVASKNETEAIGLKTSHSIFIQLIQNKDFAEVVDPVCRVILELLKFATGSIVKETYAPLVMLDEHKVLPTLKRKEKENSVMQVSVQPSRKSRRMSQSRSPSIASGSNIVSVSSLCSPSSHITSEKLENPLMKPLPPMCDGIERLPISPKLKMDMFFTFN
jgi:hypothetical protein